jgi:hypothetical protein
MGDDAQPTKAIRDKWNRLARVERGSWSSPKASIFTDGNA